MSMATRTETQSPALHVADSHDLLIRVQGARENNPIILRSAHRYSPNVGEEVFSEVHLCAFGSFASSRTRHAHPRANPNHLASKIRGAHLSLKTLTMLGVSTVTCGSMTW